MTGSSDVDPSRAVEPERSDAIWTVPNALSVLRLLLVPVFIWLLLVEDSAGWAIIVLVVSGLTDWLDGKLARWLGQSSKLGALLDPAAIPDLVAIAGRNEEAWTGLLTAVARLRWSGGRTSLWDITVDADGEVVAIMRGRTRTVGGPVVG